MVDTRHNGGGWLHEQVATLLSGKEYERFVPRGQYLSLIHISGYLDDKGIVPNSGFQGYSARLEADYQVKPWLKMEGNVSFNHYHSREQDTEGGTSNANSFYASNIMGAIYPMYVRDAQGNIDVYKRQKLHRYNHSLVLLIDK